MGSIGIVTQVYKPEIGAAQNRLHEMATGLRSLGWEVSIITSMPNYPHGKIFKEYQGRLFMREVLDEMEIRRYWLSPSNSTKVLPRLISWVSFSISVMFSFPYILRKRFDYIIIQSPPLLVSFSGLILTRLSGTKMILNVSDLWPLSARELGVISDGFFYRILTKMERAIYRWSFLCMGQSREIVNHLSSNGSKRVFLFRNGVDPKRFLRYPRNQKSNKCRIIYAGLIGVAQGVLDICRSIDFKEINVEFHIYGAGPEQKELENFIYSNNDHGIIFHGQIQRDEIPKAMQDFDATLVPLAVNLYGAVPSKIYESMAAGLPILFSGDGEGKRIVEELNLGWTSSAKDYVTLKANLIKLCSCKDELQLMQENCIYAANNIFSRRVQIERLHDELEKYL